MSGPVGRRRAPRLIVSPCRRPRGGAAAPLAGALAPAAALALPLLLLAACGARTVPGPDCDTGQTLCAGACTRTDRDPLNCGGCGHACAAGEQCIGGTCGIGCPAGQELCGDSCVNLRIDRANCGACGVSCAPGEICDARHCVANCPQGQTNCGGLCATLSNDPANCGVCGRACALDEDCVQGDCKPPCPGALKVCDNRCVDVKTDPAHCGTCTKQCAATQSCTNGTCGCATPLVACSGGCVNLKTDPSNCGSCRRSCANGQQCLSGLCCPPGTAVCNNSCVDLLSDPGNCGSCGHACTAAEACLVGHCTSPCRAGESYCGGLCVDTASSHDHCGGCNRPCAATEECRGSACAPACSAQLTLPVTDGWGYVFDGLERRTTSYAAAKAECESLGGRLPTATELWRVAATTYGPVGQTYTTNALWSLTPAGADQQLTVALDDAALTAAQTTSGTVRAFRCVCPGPDPAGFAGKACHGPPGAPCTALLDDGGHRIDAFDRAPMSRGAAMWECAFAHGHLPSAAMLAEAVLKGLANGSNGLLHTSDDAGAGSEMLVKWVATNTGWVADGTSVSSGLYATSRAFRCVGASLATKAKPVVVSNEFIGPTSWLIGERADRNGTGYASALDACWSAGGHLPRAAELGELIEQGLQNGSNAWLWSADELGKSASISQIAAVRWQGAQLGYFTETNVQTSAKTTASQASRCIWYYIDPGYTGPSSGCSGGCNRYGVGTGTAALWIDKNDRTAATFATAVSTCGNLGGHLATARDLIEAVRHGLPNGSAGSPGAVPLQTSDLAAGGITTVSWTGTDTGYTGTGLGTGTLSELRPYRCVWTNELR